MPVVPIDGGEIYYEEFGSGFPVLCFSPGSLRSQISFWRTLPRSPEKTPPWMDPTTSLAPDFHIIAMDQRNAGKSRGPITANDSWDMYARDQIAVLDHLGIKKCHVLGACIGATFALKLCEVAPERIASVVLMQPIGRVPENIEYTRKEVTESWVPGLLKVNPALDPDETQRFGLRLLSSDFVHAVSREFVAGCQTPMLVMPGHETAHPQAVAEEILRLAPRAEYVKFWRGEGRDYSVPVIRDFLKRHHAN
ncbi:MAG TPA: alpha/beta hydrolase [Pseudolabrys sp.]|jgi:pimeloyl-ACP methyl ester carboxylesterase